METKDLMYPYEPLLQRLLYSGGGYTEEPISDREAGIRLGISERTVRAARHNGMDVWTADLFCTRAGLHPAIVYGMDRWIGSVIEEPAFLDYLASEALEAETAKIEKDKVVESRTKRAS